MKIEQNGQANLIQWHHCADFAILSASLAQSTMFDYRMVRIRQKNVRLSFLWAKPLSDMWFVCLFVFLLCFLLLVKKRMRICYFYCIFSHFFMCDFLTKKNKNLSKTFKNVKINPNAIKSMRAGSWYILFP